MLEKLKKLFIITVCLTHSNKTNFRKKKPTQIAGLKMLERTRKKRGKLLYIFRVTCFQNLHNTSVIHLQSTRLTTLTQDKQ